VFKLLGFGRKIPNCLL